MLYVSVVTPFIVDGITLGITGLVSPPGSDESSLGSMEGEENPTSYQRTPKNDTTCAGGRYR